MDKGGIMIKLAKKGNKKILSISRKDWEYIGKIAGWKDKAKDTAKGLWNGMTDVYNSMPQGPNDDVFSLQQKTDPDKQNKNNLSQTNSKPSAKTPSASGTPLSATIPAVGDNVIYTDPVTGSVSEGVVDSDIAVTSQYRVKMTAGGYVDCNYADVKKK